MTMIGVSYDRRNGHMTGFRLTRNPDGSLNIPSSYMQDQYFIMIYVEQIPPPEWVTVGSVQVERSYTDPDTSEVVTWVEDVPTVNGVQFVCDFYGEMCRIHANGTVTVVNVGGY